MDKECLGWTSVVTDRLKAKIEVKIPTRLKAYFNTNQNTSHFDPSVISTCNTDINVLTDSADLLSNFPLPLPFNQTGLFKVPLQ